MWEEVEHTADIAVRVWAADLAGLFAEAAYAAIAMLGLENEPEGASQTRRHELDAPDVETLLVDWLTEILILAEEGEHVEAVGITSVSSKRLVAELDTRADAYAINHIKAVTYNELAVKETEHGLETLIVFDV